LQERYQTFLAGVVTGGEIEARTEDVSNEAMIDA